jgi:hypothetical protein
MRWGPQPGAVGQKLVGQISSLQFLMTLIYRQIKVEDLLGRLEYVGASDPLCSFIPGPLSITA